MADPKEIYLQPICCADNDEVGRLWCEDPDPEECDNGVPWTKYVRADIKIKTNDDFRVVSGLFKAIEAGDYDINIHRNHISAATYLQSGTEDRYEFSTALDLESWLAEKGYID